LCTQDDLYKYDDFYKYDGFSRSCEGAIKVESLIEHDEDGNDEENDSSVI